MEHGGEKKEYTSVRPLIIITYSLFMYVSVMSRRHARALEGEEKKGNLIAKAFKRRTHTFESLYDSLDPWDGFAITS
jgi:hypothetical protein